ncbi:MAG: hypothetical protein CL681_21805 [Blastopirellula sp.]|nr:hypothetical protein [Blastopirellula sp.]
MQRVPLSFWLVLILGVASQSAKAASPPWMDTFYQYRIPVRVDVKTAGWNVIPLSASDICKAISDREQYAFDPAFLAYNHVLLTQVTESGDHQPLAEAGFHLISRGDELLGADPGAPVPTDRHGYYLVRFVSEGGKFPPTLPYEQVFPIGEPPRTHAYLSSYVPRLLPKARLRHECLLRSDGKDLRLAMGQTTTATELSVRQCTIALLAKFATPGRKELVVYYQPCGAHYLKIPQRRRSDVPGATVAMQGVGKAEKYLGNTQYSLVNDEGCDVWFAETTVKLTPKSAPPSAKRAAVQVTTAAHESQSWQLVLTPRQDFDFAGIRCSELTNGNHQLDARHLEVQTIDYVPVTRKARVNQVSFFGEIGDPLVPVTARRLSRQDGSRAFWFTLRTPSTAPAGKYRGTISILRRGGRAIEIPLEVQVYDFALPEYSTFRSNMGGQFFAKNSGNPAIQPTMAYHGVKTKQDVQRLARTYYEVMAREKFYPKNVALFTEVGMQWKAPPRGYQVADKENVFELFAWDFEAFNREMKHFIDDLKVNSVCLTHTNPSVSHVFKHLPGRPAKVWRSDPGHVTMAWQTFREMTQATYGKQPGDPWQDTSVEVSRHQWDQLVLDYYRAMARNLKKHGWLDKFYIFVDETAGTEKILHLIRLLKSDPETASIRVAHCLQGFESLWHQEDGKYQFNKLVTHVPQIDENYYRWEDYYWDDYQIPRERDRLWSYAAYSSRLGINVPGLTNRQVGLEVFRLGGSGYVIWDTWMWHHAYGHEGDPHNPWKEPFTRLANGALSYFYPPRRDGMATTPDFTITPSLRIMTFRESVDDYEYARILEELVEQATRNGDDVTDARRVLGDIKKMFPSSVEWTLNDAWYLELRDRMARQIVRLRGRTSRLQP